MKGKAHAIGGLLSTAGIHLLLSYYQSPLSPDLIDLYLGSFLGSLLPDIDHKKSMLGSIFYLPVKHRTLTHSLLFLFVVSIIVTHHKPSLGCGIFLGILSHLILDMLSPKSSGIMLFYPCKKKIRFFHHRK